MSYKCKWTENGETRYGTPAYPETKKNGHILMNLAVLPEQVWVREDEIVDIEDKWGTYNRETDEFEGVDEYQQYIQDEYRKAEEVSDSLQKFGVGAMIQTQVADGYAYYVVTKVTKKTCTVEWRGFCLDNWTDQILGYGGRFPRDRIENLWKSDRHFRQIMAEAKDGEDE